SVDDAFPKPNCVGPAPQVVAAGLAQTLERHERLEHGGDCQIRPRASGWHAPPHGKLQGGASSLREHRLRRVAEVVSVRRRGFYDRQHAREVIVAAAAATPDMLPDDRPRLSERRWVAPTSQRREPVVEVTEALCAAKREGRRLDAS